jgi:hypothetical protein
MQKSPFQAISQGSTHHFVFLSGETALVQDKWYFERQTKLGSKQEMEDTAS